MRSAKASKRILKTCSHGHQFYKSSDCPICPTCWSGYYKNKHLSDFPKKMSAPALRALLNAKIQKLSDLQKFSESEVADLHGMGPKTMTPLKTLMKKKGYKFK